MKKNQPLLYAILIVIGIYIGGSNNFSKDSDDSKLNNIIQMIHEHYVDSLDYRRFQHDAINSILSELDPHSSYISTEDFKSIEEDMQGSFSGIGVEFNIIKDTIVVISPISGGPSEKLGIQSGDRITHVEEEEVACCNRGVRWHSARRLMKAKGVLICKYPLSLTGHSNAAWAAIVMGHRPCHRGCLPSCAVTSGAVQDARTGSA